MSFRPWTPYLSVLTRFSGWGRKARGRVSWSSCLSKKGVCDLTVIDLNCFKCHMNEDNNCPSSGTPHPLTVFSPEPEVTQVITASVQIRHVASGSESHCESPWHLWGLANGTSRKKKKTRREELFLSLLSRPLFWTDRRLWPSSTETSVVCEVSHPFVIWFGAVATLTHPMNPSKGEVTGLPFVQTGMESGL